MQARTVLFQQLKKSIRQASEGGIYSAAQASDGKNPSFPHRRRFLRNALGLGAGVALGSTVLSCQPGKRQPRIAIIGAGLAGLSAAFQLKKQGIHSSVYEGSSRVGGRTFTLKDFAAPGTWTEMGGQYIDTSHVATLQLCKELGLPLLDVEAPSEQSLVQMDYFFGGKRYSDKDFIAEFATVAPVFERDMAAFPEVVGYKTPQFKDLDNMTLEEYLEKSGTPPLLRQALTAAFTCEYGRDLGEQSALNMIYLLPPSVNGNTFEAWGESDERYVVDGGSTRISETMAGLLEGQVELEHLLSAISPRGEGYRLSFQGGKEVDCDSLILALPFTMLRKVDIRLELPPQKRRAIQELGYGTNSKMALGFNERVWRKLGYTGNLFNETLQNAWEHTQMQNGNQGPGGFTVFLGGAVGKGMSNERSADFLSVIEQAYPGSKAAFNEKKYLFNWATNLYVGGSYTCYLPGQWTGFGGAETEPVGNIFFAGEHCSLASQGFMDGAVESGLRAATLLAQKLR